jgi:signal transduction histidine kinase
MGSEAAEAMAALLKDVAIISNQSNDPSRALPAAIRLVCQFTGWPAGFSYQRLRPEPDSFVHSGVRWIDPESPLLGVADLLPLPGFRRGEGVLGQVAAEGTPAWISRLAARGRFSPEVVNLGLKAAFVIPILSGSRVTGILEFLVRTGKKPRASYLDAIAMVGTQMGRVLERQEQERDIADMAIEEQRNIGSEIHDGLGQQLAGLGLIARNLHRRLERKGEPEAEASRRLLQGLEEAKRQVRLLARGLVPVQVDAQGLMSALDDLVEGVERDADVRCTFDCQGKVPISDNFRATHLFRIAQEAVNNAVRHGNPSRIDVRLRLENQVLALEIADDGTGMAPDAGNGNGLGLRSMRNRARLIQGDLRFSTSETGGVLVSCRVAL